MTSPIPQTQHPDRSTRYLPTTDAYDLWASTYDTDGNFLQALDSVELTKLIPDVLSRLPGQPWKIIDLGCGTGRAILQILGSLSGKESGFNAETQIIGLEPSAEMLQIATKKIDEALIRVPEQNRPDVRLEIFDILSSSSSTTARFDPKKAQANVVTSTLVLEHVPVVPFFATAASMLQPNGFLLVTNMHADMGAISQAGFVDPATGEKVRPTSYAHTVDDMMRAARDAGFELIGSVKERKVEGETSERLGTRAQKWRDLGVKVWFGAIFKKPATWISFATMEARARASQEG